MSAAHHLQQGQLRMFIPAEELQSYEPNPMDAAAHNRRQDDRADLYAEYGESYEHVPFWDAKRSEAASTGLADKVAREGVKQPVNVLHTDEGGITIANGHHRTASAAPGSLVPVRHYGDPHNSYMHAMWDQQEPQG